MGVSFESARRKNSSLRGSHPVPDGSRCDVNKERLNHIGDCDSEFWLCICMPDEESLAALMADIGAESRVIDGEALREGAAHLKPERPMRQFARTAVYDAGEPLLDVEYTGILEVDCLSECDAVLDALEHPVPDGDPTGSPHHLTAFFASREDKEAFLADWCMAKYGDKYVDGARWLKSVANRSR